MPNISDINGVAIASLGDFNGVAKASITDINGVTIVVSGTNLLLDTYTGAAAAYSVRKLDKDYTGNCMRVRRDSDDSETDIGFGGSGDLDTAAIATHCGSANGYVVTWYDQSGNSVNATQSTDGSQPQIYNGSAVITNNGKPGLQFDSSGQDQLFFTAVSTVKTVFSVCGNDGSSFSTLLGADTPSTAYDKSLRQINGAVWYLDSPSTAQDWYNEANGDAYIDGSQVTGRPSGGSQQLFFAWNTSPVISFSSIAARYLNRSWYGKIQEIVIYENTDYIDSTNRSGIETDLNAYFQIGNFGTPTSGLLSTYSGAVAAYSVRQLVDFAIKSLRVRRDNDDVEQDFGFDANGDLDTSAIATFVGSGNNGYVSKWYDQSGNGNHAAQTTHGSQPKIYDGSAVNTVNGKPIVGEVNVKRGQFLTPVDFSGDFTTFQVGKRTQANHISFLFGSSPYWPYAGAGSTDSRVGSYTTTPVFYGNGSSMGITRSDVYNLWVNQCLFVTQGELTASNLKLGFNGTSFSMPSMQELIIWNSDQSSNRSGIEGNLNAYFQIGNFGTPTSGLLSTYTGAAAAYSVRQLANTAALCMRVRRDNDDAEQDFGFDANGDLDTAAIATFVGSGNNGYVSKWYDQSGNGNDAAQSTNGSQPQIYNGSAVITENGKPALDFDGTADCLNLTSDIRTTAGPATVATVYKNPTSNIARTTLSISKVGRWLHTTNSGYNYLSISTSTTANESQKYAGYTINTQDLFFVSFDGSTQSGGVDSQILYVDGSLQTATVNTAGYGIQDSGENGIGYRSDTNSQFALVKFQELIIYDSDQSSNRSGIETDINDYFSIY